MKSPIRAFCDERKIPDGIRNAFTSYCRTKYAKQYELSSEGDTVHLVLAGMTQEQVEQAWLEFIGELKNYLPKEQVDR